MCVCVRVCVCVCEWAGSGGEQKTLKNHPKIVQKFTKNRQKIVQKSIKNGLRRGSRVHPSAGHLLGAPWEPLGRLLGRSWAALGAPGGPPGACIFFLTASWAPLGAVLAPSWTPWVALRTLLGTPWTPPGASWRPHSPHRAHQDAISHENPKSSPRCSESSISEGPELQISSKNR